jgi:hypothetical protein
MRVWVTSSPPRDGYSSPDVRNPSRTWDADTPAALEFATSRSDRRREHDWALKLPSAAPKRHSRRGSAAKYKVQRSKASVVYAGKVLCRCPAVCDAGHMDHVSRRSWQSSVQLGECTDTQTKSSDPKHQRSTPAKCHAGAQRCAMLGALT